MTISNATQLICFFALSATLILGALGVVLLPNIVYSAFLLGSVFLSVAGLYLLLNASFVAAAQVLIYVGAVNVLILFAIMLVNREEELKVIPGLAIRRFFSGVVCMGLLVILERIATTTHWAQVGPIPLGEEATIRIGEHLFSDYLLPFELASILLLIAMIGAIVLARKDLVDLKPIIEQRIDPKEIKLPSSSMFRKKSKKLTDMG
uniref:NAD(P)H-quinone oxidoreductase subunit 6, organellar chromatophore n=1 Tax=Paulinella chromatophora TaxID=39717 RepID=NU6C_PAUCH|nr:NADH dehydrogenase subunit J [Paulinella chromatophora]B1X496.1 RecName: Full=NAD(P)H-quinone oxidoreductase subunit 6, organellar chromatophore; AltName: Full=NAD(P)H dehydrogenase subunit 6; AltName: Full=NADH-plastoquinone oxidoreductase subunit 6 [Paulinella chromatophora]ACB42765.1 NADH dehydrogenase subunit J [Paulinella chromatophora]